MRDKGFRFDSFSSWQLCIQTGKHMEEYYLNDRLFFSPGYMFNVAATAFMEWYPLTLRAFCIRHNTWVVVLQSIDHPVTQLCPLPFTGRGSAPFLKAACHLVYVTHGHQQLITGTPKRKEVTTRKPLLCSCGLGDSFPEASAGVSFNRTTGT